LRPLLFGLVDNAHGALAEGREDAEWTDAGGM
jgi:hypothetical protein